MGNGQVIQPRYKVGQICRFTNRGESGLRSNDGKLCEIVSIKPANNWMQGEPEYVIIFLEENRGFGVRECELEPTKEKGDNS